MKKDVSKPVLSDQKHLREAGVLLPVFSLPSDYGIGDLGPEAYAFIDGLKASGQRLWQILPLNPTSFGNSPYQCVSAFAGNPYMISPELLVEKGLLKASELARFDFGSCDDIDYGKLHKNRPRMLKRAYNRWKKAHEETEEWAAFERDNAYWLEDYALFMALKTRYAYAEWVCWDEAERDRRPERIAELRTELAEEIRFWKFCQYEFFCQWQSLRAYASANSVKIIGDMPFYVAFDSADVWADRKNYLLSGDGLQARLLAGVPSDVFSDDDRCWGNPIYDWDAMASDGYTWWRERVLLYGSMYDIIRIDHVIALVRFYGINPDDPNENCWYMGPDAEEQRVTRVITEAARKTGADILAEDLGSVNDRLRELLKELDWAGMRVLQFAFNRKYGSKNSHITYNHTPRLAVYTGTHDNETLAGYLASRSDEDLDYMKRYLKAEKREELLWAAIEEAYRSPAEKVIIPMQDILGLDNRSRNVYQDDYESSWRWRMPRGWLTDGLRERLIGLAQDFGRLG